MMLALVALLGGVALGLRFKFLVLFPAMVVAGSIVLLIGRSDGLAATVLTVAMVSLSLQVGYVLGLATYQAAAVVRAGRLRRAVLQSRRPVSRHA